MSIRCSLSTFATTYIIHTYLYIFGWLSIRFSSSKSRRTNYCVFSPICLRKRRLVGKCGHFRSRISAVTDYILFRVLLNLYSRNSISIHRTFDIDYLKPIQIGLIEMQQLKFLKKCSLSLSAALNLFDGYRIKSESITETLYLFAF